MSQKDSFTTLSRTKPPSSSHKLSQLVPNQLSSTHSTHLASFSSSTSSSSSSFSRSSLPSSTNSKSTSTNPTLQQKSKEAKIQSLLREINTLKSQIEPIQSELLSIEDVITKEENSIEEMLLKSTAFEKLDQELKNQIQTLKQYIQDLQLYVDSLKSPTLPSKDLDSFKKQFKSLLKQLAPTLLSPLTPTHASKIRSQIEHLKHSLSDSSEFLTTCIDHLSLPFPYPELPKINPPHAPLQSALAKLIQFQSMLDDQVQHLTHLKSNVESYFKLHSDQILCEELDQKAFQTCFLWLSNLHLSTSTFTSKPFQEPAFFKDFPSLLTLIPAYHALLDPSHPSHPSSSSPTSPTSSFMSSSFVDKVPSISISECMNQIHAFQFTDPTNSSTSSPPLSLSQWYTTDYMLHQLANKIHHSKYLALEADMYTTLIQSWQLQLQTPFPSSSLSLAMSFQHHQEESKLTLSKLMKKETHILESQPPVAWHLEIEKLRDEKYDLLNGKDWAKFLHLDKDIQQFKKALFSTHHKV